VLQSTDLWHPIEEGDQFIPEVGKKIKGRTLSPLVLGDSAFPSQTWFIASLHILTSTGKLFVRLSSVFCAAEYYNTMQSKPLWHNYCYVPGC
jgi:hypothetical protein